MSENINDGYYDKLKREVNLNKLQSAHKGTKS